MRIIFAGTPDFATPCLQALLKSRHEVVAVYSQPDRPAGRGRKLTPSPVKKLAVEYGLPVFQPMSLRDEKSQAELEALQADLMVVVAYGLILPQAVLDTPRLGCINVHASLLPRWRGAAPIQRAIEAGDAETGVTLMQMDAGLDTGDILLESRCPISRDDTGGSLHDRLSALGADLLTEGVEALDTGRIQAHPQSVEGVTYAGKLSKAEARVDWNDSAEKIARRIHAFNPWPVCHSHLDGEQIRLWYAHCLPGKPGAAPGTVIAADDQGIDIACGEGLLRILQLQWPGGRPLNAGQACHGHDLIGRRFE